MKVIVFDLGGTLMDFEGMPLCWADYYKTGFENLAKALNCDVSKKDIALSAEIMKSYNPRIHYREKEYSPDYIFRHCLKHWNTDFALEYAAEKFFNGIQLKAVIYDDSVEMLQYLKAHGYTICALTDIPAGMPDAYFKLKISSLLSYIDFYVSSQSCGFRKPNIHGMKLIAEKFNVDLSDLIFVGDEEKDKLVAEKIGCKFYLIDRMGTDENADINAVCELKNLI